MVGDESGKLLQLLGLIEEHRTSLTRDFAEKFGLSLSQVGVAVPFQEASDLIVSLLADPTSWFRAERLGWKHPLSHEGMALLNMTDVLLSRWVKDHRMLPRPWDGAKSRTGKRLSRRETLAILRPGKEIE